MPRYTDTGIVDDRPSHPATAGFFVPDRQKYTRGNRIMYCILYHIKYNMKYRIRYSAR